MRPLIVKHNLNRQQAGTQNIKPKSFLGHCGIVKGFCPDLTPLYLNIVRVSCRCLQRNGLGLVTGGTTGGQQEQNDDDNFKVSFHDLLSSITS